MAPNQIRLIGGPELIAKLQEVPGLLMQAVEVAVAKGLLSMQRDLARYPPQDALSTYRRTGQLGRLWTSEAPVWEPRTSGFLARIGNATSYGPYVQDEATQNPHNDAWFTVQMVLDDHEGDLVLYIGAALAEAIEPLND